MSRHLKVVSVIASLAAICFAAYGDVLGFYFTSWDAFPLLLIGKIDSVNDLWVLLSSPLGGGFPFGRYYRPVSELSYAMDYLLWWKNPSGYHLTSILLHLLNSVMLFAVARRIFRDHAKGYQWAWVSALLFVVSPLSAGVIPSIARRQDMLLAFFLCVTLLAFMKMMFAEKSRGRWHALSLAAGFLTVFVKESAFVTPVLVMFLFFVYSDGEDYGKRMTQGLKYSLPFFGFAAINAALHLYLFGAWGVQGPSNRFQHIEAAMRSFRVFGGPLQVLNLGKRAQIAIMFAVMLFFIVIIVRMLSKYKLRGFLEIVLARERRNYTYLVMFILSFLALFTAIGKSHYFYHYTPYMAFTILTVMMLHDKFENKAVSMIARAVSVTLILYTIIYSPLVTKYSAWKYSSDITRQTIIETETALRADSDASLIYLINWPRFIDNDPEMPGKDATILVGYSMDAWARWSGLSATRDVEFVHVSYTGFPSGDLMAEIKYKISEKKIEMAATGCRISLSKIPRKGEIPFVPNIDSRSKRGELVFTRRLNHRERLFLYDVGGIRVIGGGVQPYQAIETKI